MAQSAKSNSELGMKALDVVAPGKTPPPPSGKPIIVTNRPMIKDPMMPDSLQPANESVQLSSRVGKPVDSTLLMPNGEADRAATSGGLSDKKTMKTIAVPSATAPAHVESPVSDAKPEKSSERQPATDAVAPDGGTPTPRPTEDKPPTAADPPSPDVPLADNAKQRADQEREARLAEQEKIIASKQYYLPIANVERRRSNSQAILWLLLVVLGSFVWLDLVLDAGIVHIGGVHALTHFFRS